MSERISSFNKIRSQILPLNPQEYRDSGKTGLKRGFEAVSTAFVSPFAAAAIGVLGYAVKQDGGPAFYSSKRVQRIEQTPEGPKYVMVDVYKLRSMREDADKLSAAEIAEINTTVGAVKDPRVTKIGRLLRKTNLDELPQLFQVLWGDFALVGDRIKSKGAMEEMLKWRDELVMDAVNLQANAEDKEVVQNEARSLIERAMKVQKWHDEYNAGLFSAGNVTRGEIKDDKKAILIEADYHDKQNLARDIGVIAQTVAYMGVNAIKKKKK